MTAITKDLNISVLSRELEEASLKRKKSIAAKKITPYSNSDIAKFLDKIALDNKNEELLRFTFNIIPKEVLSLVQSHTINQLIRIIGKKKITHALLKLELQDISRNLKKISPDYKSQIIDVMKQSKKREVLEILSYVENTADKIMDTNYIAFNSNVSVKEALAILKNSDINVNNVIVIDNVYQPIGIVTLLQLYKANPITSIGVIMIPNKNVISNYVHIQDVFYLSKKYSLDVIPVVNQLNRLVGVINLKDILQVISKQTEKDIMSFEGLYYQDTFSNILNTVKHRFPWLFVNLVAAISTSLIINKFNDTIMRIIVLAAIMPIIACISGNAASQVMTITIRAIINKYISEKKSALRTICKEIIVSLLNGVLISIIGSIMLFVIYQDSSLNITFIITVMINLLFGSVIGSSVPIILHYWDIDSAASAVVIVNALTDAFSFFSFLGIAYYIMT